MYPSVQGSLTSTSTDASTNCIFFECLLDTGCLFANFVKTDIARRLGTHTHSVDTKRLVTLADGSLTSSVGYVNCDVTLILENTSIVLKDVTLHMLPGIAFDVILGFLCIRKYNLITTFSYLFSESNLQVHNCTKCRQCSLAKGLPAGELTVGWGDSVEGPVGSPLCECVASPT